MKEIFKLLEELDELSYLCYSVELFSDKSGQLRYGGNELDPDDLDFNFESLEECETLLKSELLKLKAENKKANTATYSMPELKEVQKLIDKLSEDIGRIFSS